MVLVEARLVKRDTGDGVDFIKNSVPIGKVYWINLETLRQGSWYKTSTGKTVLRQTVDTYDKTSGFKDGSLPTELLEWEGTC